MVPDSIASTKTRLFTRNLFIVFIILTASFIIMDFVFWEIEDKIQTHDIISESFIIIFFMAALIIWVRAMRNYETILVAIALAVLSYAAVINLLDEFFDQPQGFGDADQFVNLLGLIIFVVALHKDRVQYLNLLDRESAAKQKAEEMGSKYKILFEKANDAVFLETVDGKILEANKKACELLGYQRSELLKLSVLDIVPNHIQEKLPDIIKEDISKGTAFIETENVRKDGSLVPVEVSISLMKVDQQQLVLAIARDITERKKVEEIIKISLHEKETLLKEIHHRVKNNLQVVSSLLYLQSKSTKDKNISNVFMESQNRIRSMSMVHEKLYQSESLSQININNYIEDFTNYLFRTYNADRNKIKLQMEIEEINLDIKTAIPCALILNELISNAVKYAFPGDRMGDILVRFRLTEDAKYEFEVKDNGIGLPKNFNLNKTESLGLQLVNTLCDQIQADLVIDNKNGTSFKMYFYEKKET
ncbi:hypothetical protein B6I21_00885 [candidate division KSB1 bacterium 4572_119]|nr:MAG: hypothetical protein B6I21_00885 [candidate division KSB1 bacterium 4572_119]